MNIKTLLFAAVAIVLASRPGEATVFVAGFEIPAGGQPRGVIYSFSNDGAPLGTFGVTNSAYVDLVAHDGSLYAATATEITKFSPAGQVLDTLDFRPEKLYRLEGDADGKLYVLESWRVSRLSENGSVELQFLTPQLPSQPPYIIPFGIDADSRGRIYVALSGGTYDLATFDSSGLPLSQFNLPELSTVEEVVIDQSRERLYASGVLRLNGSPQPRKIEVYDISGDAPVHVDSYLTPSGLLNNLGLDAPSGDVVGVTTSLAFHYSSSGVRKGVFHSEDWAGVRAAALINVPEPATTWLFFPSLLGAIVVRRVTSKTARTQFLASLCS
jgi:hypothetical protein